MTYAGPPDTPSMRQLTALLDNAPVAVVVSDPQSYRVLYANRLSRQTLLKGVELAQVRCYVTAGFDQPCPFCHGHELNQDELLVREFQHPVTGRFYQLSGKLIDWGDGLAHIEYIKDITLEREEAARKEALRSELAEIFQNLPCGLCVYQVDFPDIVPRFHNPAFFEIAGYSEEHMRQVGERTEFLGVHPEDVAALQAKVMAVARDGGSMEHTYRLWNDRRQEYRWLRLEGTIRAREDGERLFYAVYSDVTQQRQMEQALISANAGMGEALSALREAQQEMGHLVNSIPGGIASYRLEGEQFVPTYISDGLFALSGHTRAELGGEAAQALIYAVDRPRVSAGILAALKSGEVLDISYRIHHKNGTLVWIHLNGRRMGPQSDAPRFYAVITGMSAEALLFQSIANETADGIYVIDKERYDLLYINESKRLFQTEGDRLGEKCYAALHGLEAPCPFCTLKTHPPDGVIHEMVEEEESGRFFTTRFRETDWNGIPAYVKYVQDVTEEVQAQRQKVRLEQYFQTLLRHLPGGVAVIRYQGEGRLVPEYLSEGFAAMLGITQEEAWRHYRQNAMAGIHPEDLAQMSERLQGFIARGEGQEEQVCRMKKGDGGYLWVKITLSLLQSEDGVRRLYIGYHDITGEREEQERLQRQYNELILQHYRAPGPNALIVGHCNVTQNRILEIIDHTGSDLLRRFGTQRQGFFKGLSTLVADPEQRQRFLGCYLNEPALAAFRRGEADVCLDCFVKLSDRVPGRYVRFHVNMVEAPDSGDVTGILTVTDITEQVISRRILNRISLSNCDMVVDLDLGQDRFKLLSGTLSAHDADASDGRHSERIAYMLEKQVVPRDKARVERLLAPAYMRERLKREEVYSFHYTIYGEQGELLTKKLTVAAIDLRLDRVCLSRADVTDSVREQQGLLNVVAHTFELLGVVQTESQRATIYTRQTVLENLSPRQIRHYENAMASILTQFHPGGGEAPGLADALRLEVMLAGLEEHPEGYDFVYPSGTRYKQITILWGDREHKTVCMVQADVTDMLAEERRTKEALEQALALASQASQAKSDFLSTMSHDIRTPMNAITGMATLAEAHMDDRQRVADCLRKISVSSRHLLSLVNDILDMSKIERGKLSLNLTPLSVQGLLEQITAIIGPQARTAGLRFQAQAVGIRQDRFCGDALRINQILLNILGNAVKFTPAGGSVDFLVEERPAQWGPDRVRYRFTVRDTGVGMSEAFLAAVFDPFTRSREVSHIEGTGLGLSISKGLVDLMQGDVAVESQVGQGTVFHIELEFERAQADAAGAAEPPAGARPPFVGRRVLVAEDNAINAEITCGLLELYGVSSQVRGDGAQALQAFREAPPGTYDAILMDIQMPVMNGYEATAAIRSLDRPDAKEIPIIAMTANAFSEDIQTALAAGMTAHVAKPVDMDVLYNALHRAFSEA